MNSYVRLILAVSFLCLLPACAAGMKKKVIREGTEQVINVPAERVWVTSVAQFQGLPISRLDGEKMYFETSWLEGFTERPKSFLDRSQEAADSSRRQRLRLFIAVDKLDYGMSRLGIYANVEEGLPKPSGGYQWYPLESSKEVERQYLQKIVTALRTT